MRQSRERESEPKHVTKSNDFANLNSYVNFYRTSSKPENSRKNIATSTYLLNKTNLNIEHTTKTLIPTRFLFT